MDEKTEGQLRVIRKVVAALQAAGLGMAVRRLGTRCEDRPNYARAYVWDDVSFSTAYLDRQSEESSASPLGGSPTGCSRQDHSIRNP